MHTFMSDSLESVSSLKAVALPLAVPWFSVLPAASTARRMAAKASLPRTALQAACTLAKAPLAASRRSCNHGLTQS